MIVTRFAPSPTGYLHIGGARTALFCWLMARHNQGRFILRIEDTDQKRNTPTATQQVMSDLRWLGIDWDEGPDVGGPHGPYLQSQRLEIYNKYIAQLLASGHAYYCFDTQEELQTLREDAAQQKKTFTYPRPEVFPNAREMEKARSSGQPVVVRFAVPEGNIVVKDVVRGEVTFAAGEIGDFIIQKSDGYPTYHFACVVDDELMEVTHVIRGQEHLMNTPCHLVLQRALGFREPIYAHMSVTISEGGGKLSKRDQAKTLLKAIKSRVDIDRERLARAGDLDMAQLESFLAGKSTPDAPQVSAMAAYLGVHLPEINVVDFIKSGYLPEAMVNFIALLGWNPGDNREIMSTSELIAAFDPDRLTKTNSLFDRQKLVAFNTEHIRMVEPKKLLGYFKNYLEINDSPLSRANDATLARLIKINEGARTLAQIEEKCLFLFKDSIEYDPQAVNKVLKKVGTDELLQQAREALAGLGDWQAEKIHQLIEELCRKNNVGMGKIAQPIRVAVTGSTISPPIHESLELLGKERTIQRIDNILKFLQQQKDA